jgi:hypothetical protein
MRRFVALTTLLLWGFANLLAGHHAMVVGSVPLPNPPCSSLPGPC